MCTIPHRLPPAPVHRVHLLAASTRPLLPCGVTSHPHGPPLLLLVAMHGGSSLAMVSGMSIPDSSGTQRYPNRPSLSWRRLGCPPPYAPSPACARRVTAYPRRCASAPAVAGRGSKEFVKGFPSLPDVLFADVIQGPTNISRLGHKPLLPMYRWGAPRMRTSTPLRLRSVPAATSKESEKIRLMG